MDPEAETRNADTDQGWGLAEGLVCATVTLILLYVKFIKCVGGFVVNSVLFPTCLMFLTAKLVDAVGFGPHKSPGYPCEV